MDSTCAAESAFAVSSLDSAAAICLSTSALAFIEAAAISASIFAFVVATSCETSERAADISFSFSACRKQIYKGRVLSKTKFPAIINWSGFPQVSGDGTATESFEDAHGLHNDLKKNDHVR
jgi:hypothetical protein